MTCTYDLTTDIGKVRLATGDVTCATAQLTDEEIQALLDACDTWQEAALQAVDGMIARLALSSTDVAMGPRRENRSQRIGHLQLLKQHLAENFGLTGALLSALDEEDLTFGWVTEEEDE